MLKVILWQIVKLKTECMLVIASVVLSTLADIGICVSYFEYIENIESEKAEYAAMKGHYEFSCSEFDADDIDDIECRISETAVDSIVIASVSSDVTVGQEELNTIVCVYSDSHMKRIAENPYDDTLPVYLVQGSMPQKDNELLYLGDVDSNYRYSADYVPDSDDVICFDDEERYKAVGELDLRSQGMPLEMYYGFVATKKTFKKISKDNEVKIYVFCGSILTPEQEQAMKSIVSEYAEIADASFSRLTLEENMYDSQIAFNKLLTVIGINVLMLLGISSVYGLINANARLNSVMEILGLSKIKRCGFTAGIVAVNILASMIIVKLVEITASKVKWLSFIYCNDLRIVNLLIIYISVVCIILSIAFDLFKSERRFFC